MLSPNLDGAIEANSRALIDRGLLLLGDALRAHLEPHLRETYGPEWATEVRPRHGRFGRRDLASYAQCLFGERDSEVRQVFREGLGVPFWKVDRLLGRALDVRNRFAHPDEPVDLRRVKNDIGQLVLLAGTLRLGCVDELHGIVQAAEALSSGSAAEPPVEEARVQELEERAEQAAAEADLLRRQLAAIEADRERAYDEWMRAEQELQATIAVREDLEARAESLRRELDEADTNSVLFADLQQQLELAERQVAKQAERLAKSDKERAALKRRLEKQVRKAGEAEQRADTAESERDELAGSIAFTQALIEPEQHSAEDLVEQFQDLLARLVEAGLAQREDEQQEQAPPAPGEPWPYPRGNDVRTLSAARRALVTHDGQSSLDEVLPGPVAARLIDSFLEIRPTGGRVWVNEVGDATTYVDGVLTYLGRLTADPDVFNDPPVGTPYPGRGNRYSVSSKGIQRLSDGAWLASQIGNARARAVLQRLRAVRPRGRYRVDSTGAVTTYLDGEWVFAGRVRPDEWFPGEIAAA